MGLLDYFVDRYFQDEKAGKVVAFPVDGRIRGYVVRSESEERKIRAFLKMYHSAELLLQLVSLLLTIGWITNLVGTDTSTAHFLRGGAIFLVIYSLVVALPYVFLHRAYKKAFLNFVSADDEVQLSAQQPKPQQVFVRVVLVVFAIAMLLGIIMLVRSK
jgi:hypothetical protein